MRTIIHRCLIIIDVRDNLQSTHGIQGQGVTMSNSGRQSVSQKVALGRAALIIDSALNTLEYSSIKFIAIFAIRSRSVIAGLAGEHNSSSNYFTRLINSTRVGYHALKCIADRATEETLEKGVAINAIGLADYFLGEFQSRPDRNPVDLVEVMRQPIDEATRLNLYAFDTGPIEPHRITFEAGQKVEIDGQRWTIIGIDIDDHRQTCLRLEIDRQPDESSL